MALIFQNNLVIATPSIVSITCATNTLNVVVRNNHNATAVVEFSDSPNFFFPESVTLTAGQTSDLIEYGLVQGGTQKTIYARAIAGGSTSAVRTRTVTVQCFTFLEP
jgi:hypothetical protein